MVNDHNYVPQIYNYYNYCPIHMHNFMAHVNA